MSLQIFSLWIPILILTSVTSFATPFTFFGYDTGRGENRRLTIYTNASAASENFLSHLMGVGTEDFEDVSIGLYTSLDLVFPGSGRATLTGSGTRIDSITGNRTNGVGRYAISGSHYVETGDKEFTITFSDPVAAFGFWGVDIGDFSGDLIIQTSNGSYTLNTSNNPGGSVMFWGIIDPALLKSITFINTAAGTDYFAFDDMTIGSLAQVDPDKLGEVPEPTTVVLVGAGLTGVMMMSLRKKPY